MARKHEVDKGEQIQAIFGDLQTALPGAIKATMYRTPEEQIAMGTATSRHLREPIETAFGTFNQVYRYRKGCVPQTEFARGIQSIQFLLKGAEGPDVLCELAQTPEGGYRIRADQVNADETLKRDEPPILFEEVHERDLPEQLFIGQILNEGKPGEYHIDSIGGLMNGSRDYTA